MSILELDLNHETIHRLQQKAVKQGVPVTAYAEAALEALARTPDDPPPLHSIMELEGLGADLWKDEQGILLDAQDYVNELRKEWDHRP